MSDRLVWTAAILGAAILVLGSFGCASSGADGDPWTTHYVGSPDDVWTAIHIALIELDSDIESENREDGLVKAVRDGASDGSVEILSIDQIMRNDEVKVYVRAASGEGEPTMTMGQQAAIAKEFLALLNGVLYK